MLLDTLTPISLTDELKALRKENDGLRHDLAMLNYDLGAVIDELLWLRRRAEKSQKARPANRRPVAVMLADLKRRFSKTLEYLAK